MLLNVVIKSRPDHIVEKNFEKITFLRLILLAKKFDFELCNHI